jgi:hypothetical protein
MRVIVTLAVVVVLAVIAAFAFGLINISQTREAKLPEVAVSGGQAPAFHVDTAKVAVGTKETTVEVPRVKVGTEETNVKVPMVEVHKQGE